MPLAPRIQSRIVITPSLPLPYTHTQNLCENSRSIQLARKNCDNPSWIYIDTTPFYAMVRFSGGRLKHIENTTYQNMHLYSHLITKAELSISDPYFFIFTCLGKTFQKRRVSSPAPVTMDSPSGLIAR